jgi:ABC-type amino acid transport system permease subunit
METQRLGSFPYVQIGVLAGLLGALVVAVFFLLLDMIEGRAFATPTALGATLFRGEPFDLTRAPELVLVAGYSAVHGTVFVALAAIAAGVLLGVGDRLGPPGLRQPVLVVALFLALTLIWYVFSAVCDISLDGWRIVLANLLAALAMAAPLSRVQEEHDLPPDPHAHDAGHHVAS